MTLYIYVQHEIISRLLKKQNDAGLQNTSHSVQSKTFTVDAFVCVTEKFQQQYTFLSALTCLI